MTASVSGTVASHLVTDLDAIDQFVSITTSKLLVAVLSILGTAVVLLWMNWQLAAFILLLNPVVIYVTTLFGRKVKQLKRAENRAYQAFQESLAETLEAIQQIRAANRERHYLRRLVDDAGEAPAGTAEGREGESDHVIRSSIAGVTLVGTRLPAKERSRASRTRSAMAPTLPA